jgi:hypothetical protein
VGTPAVAFETVIVTAPLVPTFPLGSCATAVKVCVALESVAVFSESEYGAVVSCAPTFAPSTRNCTKDTGLSGSVAVAVRVIVPATVALFNGAVMVTTGGVVSALTVKLTPLLATPPTVTTTFPVVAPAGTAATMLAALQLVAVAVTPLNLTVLVPCVAPKFAPAIVTDAPTIPDVGFKLVILACGGFPPPGFEPELLQPTLAMANTKMTIHRAAHLRLSLKGILVIPDTMSGWGYRL